MTKKVDQTNGPQKKGDDFLKSKTNMKTIFSYKPSTQPVFHMALATLLALCTGCVVRIDDNPASTLSDDSCSYSYTQAYYRIRKQYYAFAQAIDQDFAVWNRRQDLLSACSDFRTYQDSTSFCVDRERSDRPLLGYSDLQQMCFQAENYVPGKRIEIIISHDQ